MTCAGGPKHIACAEDDDFMQAFDRMLTETVQARSNESVKVPQLDIAVPMHIRSQRAKREYTCTFTFVCQGTLVPVGCVSCALTSTLRTL